MTNVTTSGGDTAELLTERKGRVLVLTMRRPDAGNRITQALAEALIAALEEARRAY